MYEEVEITLPAFKVWLNVKFNKRTRRSLREALAALGGVNTEVKDDQVLRIPDAKLEEVKAIIAENYPAWRIEVEDFRPVKRDSQDALVWGPRRGGGWNTSQNIHTGYAGTNPLFTITFNTVDRSKGSYKVMTSLPNPKWEANHYIVGYVETTAEGEQLAERALHKFVHSIGAKFINE